MIVYYNKYGLKAIGYVVTTVYMYIVMAIVS